ncbi:MAG: Crp/Fnr family transcriptional regulator [Terracidiphilus sp.]
MTGAGDLQQNLLLSALSPADLRRVRAAGEVVPLPLRKQLFKPDQPIGHIYFVLQGMISLVQPLDDGGLTEVGVIGREGFLGVPVALGGNSDSVEAMVQMEGLALRMTSQDFQALMDASAPFAVKMLQFARAMMTQLSQTAACNSRHSLAERLSRWLLMANERRDDDIVPLSHEFLSMMLGTRRAGITVALGALKHTGIIDSARSRITILNRKRLEQSACECYGAVRQQYATIFPDHAKH